MPELPEVETISRQLDQHLRGKKIKSVEVLRDKSFIGDPGELQGKVIERIDRHSKMIACHFENTDKIVLVHLKMTGQLVWRKQGWNVSKVREEIAGGHPTEDWVKDLPDKHTRVVIHFTDESRLFFNDLRVFGWLKLVSGEEWKKIEEKLPPDVVDQEFTLNYFTKVVKGSGRAIKLVIMDSGKIGGAGNIYANDALNLARIDPKRVAKSLSDEEIKRLYLAVKKVIDLGIKYGGATYSNYRDTYGLGGRYQNHFLVYKRDGLNCFNCGERVTKYFLGGRGTYVCQNCQR